jgi:hypothetical protein
MWAPQHFITMQASTACNGDSFYLREIWGADGTEYSGDCFVGHATVYIPLNFERGYVIISA